MTLYHHKVAYVVLTSHEISCRNTRVAFRGTVINLCAALYSLKIPRTI